MAAGTRHMRASSGLFYGDFAFRALVSQEQEVNKAHDGFEIECFAMGKGGLALGAVQIGLSAPFALVHREDVVTALRRAFLDV